MEFVKSNKFVIIIWSMGTFKSWVESKLFYEDNGIYLKYSILDKIICVMNIETVKKVETFEFGLKFQTHPKSAGFMMLVGN